MEIVKYGYVYSVADCDSGEHTQEIRFVKKELSEDGKFFTSESGTTNEELLEVMISRLEFQYKKLPSIETKQSILHLKMALEHLTSRTASRMKRGVEGKMER